MDPIGTQRTTSAIAEQLSNQRVSVLPTVGAYAQSEDKLSPRAAAGPGATSSSGEGDNNEVRAGQEYSAEDLANMRELSNRDREVRAHEQAHLSAAGPHARGGASFEFEVGPDGRRYAVGGEVSIDTSEIAGDPAATLAKAQQVRRAALAPADPSQQDRQVAAAANAMAAQARAELSAEQRAGSSDSSQVAQAYATTSADSQPLIDLIA